MAALTALLLAALAVPKGYEALAASAIDALYAGDYGTAAGIATRMVAEHPEHPLGYLLKAGYYDIYMLDHNSDADEGNFYYSVNRAVALSDSLLSSGRLGERESGSYYLFRGSAKSYKAVFIGRRKDYVGALRIGYGAIVDLKEAIKRDSTLYDAYLGVGAYNYAVGYLKNVVPLMSGEDKRLAGLAMMRRASEHSTFTVPLALTGLAYVSAFEKRADDAEGYAKLLVERYPEGRTPLWVLGFVQVEVKRWRRAAETYSRLLELVEKALPDWPTTRGEVLYNIGECYRQLKETETARGYYERALSALNSDADEGTRRARETLLKKTRKRLK